MPVPRTPSGPNAVLLRLDGSLAARLLGPGGPGAAAVGRALDRSGADAVLIGADRLDSPSSPGLDASIVATTLAGHTGPIGLVVAAAPHRDHPYNLARRITSLDHVTGGRAGWLAGDRDAGVPDPAGVWTSSPLGPATTADAIAVSRELWRSWPDDTIVADHGRGVFAEAHRIVHVDHTGPFDVTGPMNLPEGPQGEPVVLWWWTGDADPAVTAGLADALVLADPALAAGVRGALGPDVRLYAEASAPDLDGVVVRLDDLPVPGLADEIRGTTGRADAATLRERLGLPARTPTVPGARRPFAPAPTS
ncbi:MAG: LLM class flavin-dependent oxidoreductase [Pseudonocardia sediminis]